MGMYRDEVRQAALMLQAGHTFEEVGDALGKSHSTIRKNVSLRNSGRIVAMFSLLDKGMTLDEVGEKFGLSKQRVAQLVGNERRVESSTGRRIGMEVSEATLSGMMDVARDLGLPVKQYKNGYDLRSLAAVLDMIVAGDVRLQKV